MRITRGYFEGLRAPLRLRVVKRGQFSSFFVGARVFLRSGSASPRPLRASSVPGCFLHSRVSQKSSGLAWHNIGVSCLPIFLKGSCQSVTGTG